MTTLLELVSSAPPISNGLNRTVHVRIAITKTTSDPFASEGRSIKQKSLRVAADDSSTNSAG